MRLSSMYWKKAINKTLLGLAIVGSGQFMSCGNDEIDIPDTPLSGTVGGEKWDFKMGFFRQFSATEFELRLFSEQELSNDPCSVVATSNPFLRVVIPSSGTSHQIPNQDPIRNFKFDLGNGTVLNATSGFIEIFAFDGFRLFGYIQAISDDDNTVQGRFEIEPC